MTWQPGRQSWSEAQPWTPSPHSDPGTRWGLLYYIWIVLSWRSLSFGRLFFKLLFPFLGSREGPLELPLMSIPPPVSSQEKTKSFVLSYKSLEKPPTISLRPARCPPWPPWTTHTSALTPWSPVDNPSDPLGRPRRSLWRSGTPYMSTMTPWYSWDPRVRDLYTGCPKKRTFWIALLRDRVWGDVAFHCQLAA